MIIKDNNLSEKINKPLVSVVIPVYNMETYLKKCLDTITKQTLQDIEIILIDDGSTDASWRICQEYTHQDSRIKFYSQEKKGIAYSKNKGIKLAQGKYISFFEPNMFFEANLLEDLYNKSEKSKSNVTFCHYSFYNEDLGEELPKSYPKIVPKRQIFNWKENTNDFFKILSPTTWNCLYSRTFLVENSLKFSSLIFSDDVFFTTKTLMMADKISVVHKKLIYYRIYDDTVFDKESLYKNSIEEFRMFERFLTINNLVFSSDIYNFLISKILQANFYLREPILTFFHDFMIKEMSNSRYFHEKSHFLNEASQKILRGIKLHKTLNPLFKENFYTHRDKIIPIILFAQKGGYQDLIIQIQSIYTHAHPEFFFDIYILSFDLNETQKRKVEELSQGNIRITILSLSPKAESMGMPSIKNFFPKIPANIYLYKTIISGFIYGYEKVLCLDPNIAFSDDILTLFQTEIKDKLITGFAEELISTEKDEIKSRYLFNAPEYIGTKVLLINLSQWDKKHIAMRAINLIINHKIVDPTILLNLLCHGEKKCLDKKFTFSCLSENNDIYYSLLRSSPYYEEFLFNNMLQNKPE